MMPPSTFSLLEVVPEAGVEPARGVTARDFESRMTANSITPALALTILARVLLVHKPTN
jgi:hypothetical protein